VQANGLKNSVDLVVTIIALAEDTQAPIDFGESRNGY
jgi:hypothetical protein